MDENPETILIVWKRRIPFAEKVFREAEQLVMDHGAFFSMTKDEGDVKCAFAYESMYDQIVNLLGNTVHVFKNTEKERLAWLAGRSKHYKRVVDLFEVLNTPTEPMSLEEAERLRKAIHSGA